MSEMDTDENDRDKIIIVQRMKMNYDGTECQVLNFKDITVKRRLKIEEEKSRLLNTVWSSVHHEMLGPLKSNIDFAKILLDKLETDSYLHRIAQLILISSNLVVFHANTMLDFQYLQNGNFQPSYSFESI